MKKTIVVIAGTSMAIQTDEEMAFFLTPLQEFYRGYLKARGPASVEITVSYNPQGTFRKFDASPILITRKHEEKSGQILSHVEGLYPFDSPLLVGFLNGVLAYNPHSRKGHLHLFRSKGKNYILGSLHKLLFHFLAIILAEEGKLMIHGAGLRLGSEGSLFIGASGSGKTTLAGCAPRDGVLSDDAPVVSQKSGSFRIHASPFSQVDLFDPKARDHHRKEAPLIRIVFLKQSNRLALDRREKRSALAEILRSHIHGFDLMDRDLKRGIFECCCDLCNSVPAFDLYFQRDDRFLSLFRE